MNSENFILIIKEVVRNNAIEDTLNNLKDPPGRGVSKEERARSDWFINLSSEEHSKIKSIISDAVDESLFGIFAVIDGVRAIESGDSKGSLKLIYQNDDNDELLNDPNKIGLHDLYNAE